MNQGADDFIRRRIKMAVVIKKVAKVKMVQKLSPEPEKIGKYQPEPTRSVDNLEVGTWTHAYPTLNWT